MFNFYCGTQNSLVHKNVWFQNLKITSKPDISIQYKFKINMTFKRAAKIYTWKSLEIASNNEKPNFNLLRKRRNVALKLPLN